MAFRGAEVVGVVVATFAISDTFGDSCCGRRCGAGSTSSWCCDNGPAAPIRMYTRSRDGITGGTAAAGLAEASASSTGALSGHTAPESSSGIKPTAATLPHREAASLQSSRKVYPGGTQSVNGATVAAAAAADGTPSTLTRLAMWTDARGQSLVSWPRDFPPLFVSPGFSVLNCI